MPENNKSTNERRDKFLIHMYDQMFNDINRHITIVWQPIAVIFSSFALFAAGVTDKIPIDFAITFIVLLIGWFISILYDSSYWYNRNLVIIANIERQFLRVSDKHDIHYYFTKHRSSQTMLTHLRINWCLGSAIGILVLLYHLIYEIILRPCTSQFRLESICPYVTAGIVLIFVLYWRRHRRISYEKFLKNSPGIEVDSTGIEFGVGHPTDEENKHN